MSKPDVWMPLYIADYLADTGRLTTEQHGAYLLLIMDYWRNGSLPDDDSVLAQVARLPADKWKKSRAIISRFFTIQDGFWTHKRIDEELESARKFIEKQRENGAKGGRPKTQKKPMGYDSVNPEHNPNESPSPSPSPLSPERVEITPHSSANAQEGIGAVTPTESGLMSKALRERNVTVTSSNPELLGWIAAGATIPLVLDALTEARVQKPEPEKIPARYLGAIVMRLLTEPKARASPAKPNKQAALEEHNRRVVEESVRKFNEEHGVEEVNHAVG